MSEQFLKVFEHLRSVTYYAIDTPTSHALNSFVKHFLYVFTQEDCLLGDAFMGAGQLEFRALETPGTIPQNQAPGNLALWGITQ